MNYGVAEEKIKEIISESSNVLDDVVDYIYQNFDSYNWIGIYIVKGYDLILGPWRGKQSTEHIKIPIGKGICGFAASSGKTEIVPDVSADNRYLSCFNSTKSEIVVPIKKDGRIIGEIDIDSDEKAAFNSDDSVFLEKVADLINNFI